MSTSLAEQLLRLQTPQTTQLTESKQRDSILFTTKEAATKSRDTIFEIGSIGLDELIELNPVLEEFRSTLFDSTSKGVQRAVESKEVNALLNKNIKRFMHHLSPYFMLPASHKCLEWLIRRFNINLYNKEELLMLILPYHQTNMFVRCIQIMKFDDPTNKWCFLADVKKSSTPLSKYALWNHGASQPAFLEFVGKLTYEAIKELGQQAGALQTIMSFYCTLMIGSMEQANSLTDHHILAIAKYIIKAYKSPVLDFTAAGYMITAQMLVKTRLAPKLLYELMNKITNAVHPVFQKNVIILLTLMFQSQNDDLKITGKTMDNLLEFDWLPSALAQMKNKRSPIIAFYRSFIFTLLERIQDADDDPKPYKELCEKLMAEVVMDVNEAEIIIR